MSRILHRSELIRGRLKSAPASDIEARDIDAARIAVVQGNCLSLMGTTCRTCEESCDLGAISFRLMTSGRAAPIIQDDRCNGCGDCAAVCPVAAIELESQDQNERQVKQ